MSYEVGVTASFESAHSLKGAQFGPAANLHGHTYKVEAVVGGSELLEDGVLCNIVEVKSALEKAVQRLHYKVLDEVQELSGINTTAEQMARYLFSQIVSGIKEKGAAKYLGVTVWENQSNFASFRDKI